MDDEVWPLRQQAARLIQKALRLQPHEEFARSYAIEATPRRNTLWQRPGSEQLSGDRQREALAKLAGTRKEGASVVVHARHQQLRNGARLVDECIATLYHCEEAAAVIAKAVTTVV